MFFLRSVIAVICPFANFAAAQQQVGRAMKPIQDVVMRYGSTYSIVERLIQLKPYLALLEEEGDLDCNLSDQQWLVISNLKFLLQPFMIAQR